MHWMACSLMILATPSCFRNDLARDTVACWLRFTLIAMKTAVVELEHQSPISTHTEPILSVCYAAEVGACAA